MNKKDHEQWFLEGYDAHADAIFRRILFKTSDREVACDLTQEVFTRTWDQISRGVEIKNLRAFLFTIANNCIKDHYKKHRALTESEVGGEWILDHVGVEGNTDMRAELSRLTHCLFQLEERLYSVVTLRHIEGYSVNEIAELFEQRANTVSVWLNRAIARIRRCLGIN